LTAYETEKKDKGRNQKDPLAYESCKSHGIQFLIHTGGIKQDNGANNRPTDEKSIKQYDTGNCHFVAQQRDNYSSYDEKKTDGARDQQPHG
jgi:hypothetical protein